MEFKRRKIEGVIEISLKPIQDERGFFMRAYDIESFKKENIHYEWVQENHSKSVKKGVIRGLHFQLPPYSETKMIRCVKGKIVDVFLDLRIDSPTFGEWDSIELSEENKKMIIIPRGMAHGFCTLTDDSEVIYKVDNFYNKEYEQGIFWADKDININWPIDNPILSQKDEHNMSFKEFVKNYKGIK